MGKISPVSAKYIVHAKIQIGGIVDRPDVIGAIFGQTEGLLGSDLELRELQRSGRLGRIEVNVDTKTGKTEGSIIIPSSLDKAETCIVGAALEIIQRIGPCNARIRIEKIEDVRVSKRQFVVDRAKELLKNLMECSMPDSQELADEVAYSVRVMEIQEYGKERLPAGPSIDDSDEVIVVEGRADVVNLLKHGIKNVIAINGTSVPQTVAELSKKKVLTAFVDGDRGGDLIIKELMALTEIDFVTKAPDGKEVEELTKKEIHKALRSKASPEQIKHEPVQGNGKEMENDSGRIERRMVEKSIADKKMPDKRQGFSPAQRPFLKPQLQKKIVARPSIEPELKKKFAEMLEDLIGTRGAYILDEKLNILGKVPFSELDTSLKSLTTGVTSGVYAVVFDGDVDSNIVDTAEKAGVQHLVGMSVKEKISTPINVMCAENF